MKRKVMMSDTAFGRQELLFGKEGQGRISSTSVAIVGVGGLGTRVLQDLAFLGVCNYVLVEPGELKKSSRNRYIGYQYNDPIPGTPKLLIAERLIRSLEPNARIDLIDAGFPSEKALSALANVDVVFGCVDREGVRFKLNEACTRLGRRYIDLATEVFPSANGDSIRYGGRVFVRWDNLGCLLCCDILDMDEVGWDLASPEERVNRERVYGVRTEGEDGSGPSVVTLNGIVASIATTEFMVGVTGLRPPTRLTNYYGEQNRFTVSKDNPKSECFTCNTAKLIA
jgi:hypothetical protein